MRINIGSFWPTIYICTYREKRHVADRQFGTYNICIYRYEVYLIQVIESGRESRKRIRTPEGQKETLAV